MDELDELWILNESGACMFNYAVDSKMDPLLFGSFFTAINQFGKQCSDTAIDDITMGKNFLMSMFLPDYHTTIVARSTHTKKRKNMKKMLKEISIQFIQHFQPYQIIDWDGNLDLFEDFEQFIVSYFNRSEKMVQNMKMIF
ncbi:hypothetical protein [Candidatus Lokiarchaeum ossiferum]|uniref:hypothetical protein n=1 Tax=Candidatus Lokiarchaeum ossiferum TaxID=2951803 RepID=UPI00352CCB47